MGIDPLTIAAVSTGAGALFSAFSGIQEGRAQAKIAEYNAQVAERDAKIAEQSASYEAAMARREGQELLAKQRAAYAKSGVKISSGSPLSVAVGTAADIERDALAIRYGGAIKSQAAKTEATQQRFYGKQAKQAGKTRAVGSLLSGTSKVAGYYA